MKIFTFSLAALLITVPWFFTDFGGAIIFGFPAWALYSLVMTVLYAVLISVLIGKYWGTIASEGEEDSEVDN